MTCRDALLVASMVIVAGCSSPARAISLEWTVAPGGLKEQGIHSLSGSDGVTTMTRRGGVDCLSDMPGTTPPSTYLYFGVDQKAAGTPVFVRVDYWDELPGGVLALDYDSDTGSALRDHYRTADDEAGGYFSGSHRWRTAIFRLDHPQFNHQENVGGDFRLSGGLLFVRSVQLTENRPADWAAVSTVEVADVRPLVKIGAGGQLIVGGFDPAHPDDSARMARALEASIPALQALGVTSHEGYVRWNLCEPEEGHYDWSVYDRFVDVYRRHHLKWVPFLIIGSAYSLPDWYYKKPGSQGYVCLEHGQESDVQSLWNPVLREHVARFLKAFCEHYKSTGVIESILLGITGNYGEAIYPVSGNDWTAGIHGNYHSHPGYWAGDPFAVADFRRWLTQKYRTSESLSRSWGNPELLEEVKPFLQADAPNDRAWLDFTDWYIGSMTNWASFWLQETRRNFPRGDIYLCTGGHAPPEHGSDFGEQCRVAAAAGAGVRITNESSDYRGNFSLTRWVASAGRQYGAYFSFEPASGVSAEGVIARIYNATASGARGLHYYYPNLFDTPQARDNFIRFGGQFQQRKPLVEIAVYYPETYIQLHGNDFLPSVQRLRDRFDFDYMSDGQIATGGLQHIRALILVRGNVAEARTWQAITEWVRRGGLLLYPDGMGRLRTVEGDESVNEALSKVRANGGKGRMLTFHGEENSAAYRDFLSQQLSTGPELSPLTRAMVGADGRDDSVFVTACAPNSLLWLNYSAKEAQTGGANSITLQPFSILEQKLPDIAR